MFVVVAAAAKFAVLFEWVLSENPNQIKFFLVGDSHPSRRVNYQTEMNYFLFVKSTEDRSISFHIRESNSISVSFYVQCCIVLISKSITCLIESSVWSNWNLWQRNEWKWREKSDYKQFYRLPTGFGLHFCRDSDCNLSPNWDR